MSVRIARKKSIASSVLPAVAGLVLMGAGVALPSAQAAQTGPAHPAAPALHSTASYALGSTSNIFENIFTEAPDGTVFYSKGSVIYVQKGTAAPAVALHAGHTVMALAANSADLFVQVGLTVTEYTRSNGARVRHWTLTSPVRHITIAGLLVVGNTLWSWTDWATDSSGFEFGRLSRITTTSPVVHVVDKQVYPADMAANSTGLYFQDARGSDNAGFLVHITPSGVKHARKGPVDWPMALAGGRLAELSFHKNGHQFVDTFATSSLMRLSSARASDSDRVIAGTGLGLIVLNAPCSHLTCASATISKLSAGGVVSGTLGVPGAFELLTGPAAAVVTVVSGHMFLERIGS